MLLQAMGASGLFESWRITEVGAVTCFYAGPRGAYDDWPDGLEGPRRSERLPFDNVSLLADNDRMFHRIGRVGVEHVPRLPITPAATIDHRRHRPVDDQDRGTNVASYVDADVRISILWKPVPPPPRAIHRC